MSIASSLEAEQVPLDKHQTGVAQLRCTWKAKAETLQKRGQCPRGKIGPFAKVSHRRNLAQEGPVLHVSALIAGRCTSLPPGSEAVWTSGRWAGICLHMK